MHFHEPKLGLDQVKDIPLAAPISRAAIPILRADAQPLDVSLGDLESAPRQGALLAEVPALAARPKQYAAWSKSLAIGPCRSESPQLLKSTSTGETSRPGEGERELRLRLEQSARERSDQLVEILRQKDAPKFQTLRDRLFRAQQALEREQQAQARTLSSALSIGTSLLGANRSPSGH